jgi:lysozyme family protein
MNPVFITAYKTLIQHEGGYANHPKDRGGETYKGIARNFHPNWDGWSIIDRMKSEPDFPACLNCEEELDQSVQRFYKKNFWDRLLLDDCNSPELCTELFEFAVNAGVSRSAKNLQTICNAFNKEDRKGNTLFQDLVVDGIIGDRTMYAVNALHAYFPPMLKALNVLQGNHYLTLASKKVSQRDFIKGWLSRVVL